MAVSELHLQDRLTHLSLTPDLGASLINWEVKTTGQALLRHSDQAALASGTPRRLACYPLAPWSNRIAEGGFERPDGWLALAPNTEHDPYPIHGSAWQQGWHVDHHSERRARLTLDSELPFAYQATLDVHLHEGCLNLDLQVIHRDPLAAWHGLGLHPYFPRYPGTQLLAPARQVWLGDTGCLSSRPAAIPVEWSFDTQRALPSTAVDHAFSGWEGGCRIVQPEAGYVLDCQASGAEYYLLFCPTGQDFFCVEPVSHPINAHHLPARPGLRLLHEGERTSLSFSMQYRALNDHRR
ncbi:aldose 1-epimerase [Pseudomonas sp. R5(2019)]|uniref:aldose 1-epimerase n=1 Tax=Pseudomonas sp. R5(2019) TaxID=2697566 RepID=UPI001411D11A|nr:aldose 1-epimerase [Pseudomonas sp. R5(2019)]NBA95467.1 aldose 1-epimerase [Pseudomonas sp. R5(2019)]